MLATENTWKNSNDLVLDLCELDRFRPTEKMYIIMKLAILQKEWVNLSPNFFMGLAPCGTTL